MQYPRTCRSQSPKRTLGPTAEGTIHLWRLDCLNGGSADQSKLEQRWYAAETLIDYNGRKLWKIVEKIELWKLWKIAVFIQKSTEDTVGEKWERLLDRSKQPVRAKVEVLGKVDVLGKVEVQGSIHPSLVGIFITIKLKNDPNALRKTTKWMERKMRHNFAWRFKTPCSWRSRNAWEPKSGTLKKWSWKI